MRFRVIAADPPWSFSDSLPGKTRGAARQYTTLSTAEICKLQIPPTEPDALLFLWRVSSMIEDALRVCRAWGFAPKSELTWVKLTRGAGERRIGKDVTIQAETTQLAAWREIVKVAPLHIGMGRSVRASHESCLIATRGKASTLIESHSERSVIFAPVGEHSAKPEAFFELVERLSKGPRCELFGRRARPGWTVIGSDLGSTLEPRTTFVRRA